jgi:hypothetical protein
MRAMIAAIVWVLLQSAMVRGQEPGEDPDQGFFRAFLVSGEYSNWYFLPYSSKELEASSKEGDVHWTQVDTYETYSITPISLYKLTAGVNTAAGELRATYESNVGFDVDFGDSFAWSALLSDFLPGWLEPLSLEVHQLLFSSGTATMRRFSTEETLDRTVFTVDMLLVRSRYEFEIEGGAWYLSAGYRSLEVPRGVYLEYDPDSDADSENYAYYNLPRFQDRLWSTAMRMGSIGVGFVKRPGLVQHEADASPLVVDLALNLYAGKYDLSPAGEEVRYDDVVIGAELEAAFGYSMEVFPRVRLGIEDRISLSTYIGMLPDSLEEEAKAQYPGFDTESGKLSLAFGTVDVLNNLLVYLEATF